ncbi:MAG TPA: LysR substrate-binding domain-containing protein [Burkholderiales bacterium]|nr:LysR substrate-binding domain-containing protein [Burkholderiales bacterium]
MALVATRLNLTLKQLRAFVSVADSGSFTDAAAQLHLTQSAVSVLVRELEGELGFRLFERSTRRVRLSAAGADFYPLALKVIQDVDSAALSALQLQERKRGNIRVAATPLYAATVVPEAMATFRARYPGIVVRLLDMMNEQVLANVLSGAVDFGVAPQQRPPSGEIVQTPLFLDRLHLICPADHELARLRSVAWKAALRHPFVNPSHDYTVRLQMDLNAWSTDLVLAPVQEVSYFSTVLGLIKAGLGVTALPEHTVPFTRPYGLTAVPLREPVIKRQVSLFTKRGHSLSPAAETLFNFLQEFVARETPGEPVRQTPKARTTPK